MCTGPATQTCDWVDPVTQAVCGILVCRRCEAHSTRMLLLDGISPAANTIVPALPGQKNYPISNADRFFDPTDQVSPPWNVLPLNPPAINPPWGGFLARLCNPCERLVRSEQQLRMGQPQLPLPAPTGKWPVWSVNSCTCYHELNIYSKNPHVAPPPWTPNGTPAALAVNPPTYPIARTWPPRVGRWLCRQHKEDAFRALEAKKDANDDWLRNIKLDSGKIVRVDDRRKNLRMNNGRWRACRCGNEINVATAPEVLLCMACEGYVEYDPTTTGLLVPAGLPAPAPPGSRFDPANPGNSFYPAGDHRWLRRRTKGFNLQRVAI